MGKLKMFDYKGYSVSGFTYKTKRGSEVFEDGVYYTLRYGDETLKVEDGHIFWLGWQVYEEFGLATEANFKKALRAVKEAEEYILSFMDIEDDEEIEFEEEF